jgi:hypothetical protein
MSPVGGLREPARLLLGLSASTGSGFSGGARRSERAGDCDGDRSSREQKELCHGAGSVLMLTRRSRENSVGMCERNVIDAHPLRGRPPRADRSVRK